MYVEVLTPIAPLAGVGEAITPPGEDTISSPSQTSFRIYAYESNGPGTQEVIPRGDTAPHDVETSTLATLVLDGVREAIEHVH